MTSSFAPDDAAGNALRFAKTICQGSCSFVLDTENQPLTGGECKIFVIENQGKKIAIRIEHLAKESGCVKVEEEVQLLKAITAEHMSHLPTLIGFNKIPPMIAMEWVDGDQLKWSDLQPPLEARYSIIRTVAHITINLLRITKTGYSASKWISDKIHRTRISRHQAGSLPQVSLGACKDLLRRLPDFHLPEYDGSPAVLVHGDLQCSNIIVKGHQLQGVVDFGMASMVPLQFSPTYPRFLTKEPFWNGTNFDWSQCVYTQIQRDDRQCFLECIKELAALHGGNACIYAEILAREDQEEKYWWFNAISRVDIMQALETRPRS